MPNPFELMRLQNLFNPQSMEMTNQPPIDFGGVSSGTMQIPQTPIQAPMRTPDFDVNQRMREIYTPETGASERFNTLAGQRPEFEKPGIWRTIAAALSAFGPGGHEMGMQVARQPYEEKLSRWKEQIGPAQAAANLERQQNINERQLAHQTVQGELTSRRDVAREKTQEEANRIRQQRADVYDFKARNPNLKMVLGKGGNILAFNPADGSLKDTGMPSGVLSEADKIDMIQENALERIAAGGTEARTTEGVRQTGRMEVVGARGEEARKTKGTPSATQTGKAETPTQTKVRQFNTAKEFASRNPQLGKFIKFSKGNEFTITPPGKGGMFGGVGPTPDQHAQINSAIFGGEIPVTQPGRTGATPAKTGIRVRTKEGQTGTFNGTAEEAKKAGYIPIAG